jgi:hypothetical protein
VTAQLNGAKRWRRGVPGVSVGDLDIRLALFAALAAARVSD